MEIQKNGYHGFCLPQAGVALDGPGRRTPDSQLSGTDSEHLARTSDGYDTDHVFISHAHADHAPRNRNTPVFTTPATAALIRARGHKGPIRETPFGETVSLPRANVTFYPAGHILGSAMIFVESEAGSLLYTGDCRTPPSLVTEGFELPDRPVDFLVIEATFGLPIYKWATHEELYHRIHRFYIDTVDHDETPVFLCYNLGKAQEVMYALANPAIEEDTPSRDDKVQIHHAGVALCNVYEQFGISLGSWETFDPDTCKGKPLIMPAQAMKNEVMQKLTRYRTAYVSGWATLESKIAQMGMDASIPLSDHLDFFELLQVCRSVNPKKVLLTHSPNPDIAIHFLEMEGIQASPL